MRRETLTALSDMLGALGRFATAFPPMNEIAEAARQDAVVAISAAYVELSAELSPPADATDVTGAVASSPTGDGNSPAAGLGSHDGGASSDGAEERLPNGLE